MPVSPDNGPNLENLYNTYFLTKEGKPKDLKQVKKELKVSSSELLHICTSAIKDAKEAHTLLTSDKLKNFENRIEELKIEVQKSKGNKLVKIFKETFFIDKTYKTKHELKVELEEDITLLEELETRQNSTEQLCHYILGHRKTNPIGDSILKEYVKSSKDPTVEPKKLPNSSNDEKIFLKSLVNSYNVKQATLGNYESFICAIACGWPRGPQELGVLERFISVVNDQMDTAHNKGLFGPHEEYNSFIKGMSQAFALLHAAAADNLDNESSA